MALADRIVDITSSLVGIPTHEHEAEAQELLAEVLTGAGFECRLDEIDDRRSNLVALRGSGGTFVCSHMDTHPPHDHPDPWTCRTEGDLLVGRGVVDAKGQIGALVAAVEAEPDADALVVVTCDEESGGRGSEHLDMPAGPWRVDGGLVLEPTSFEVCTAQGGQIDVRVEAAAYAAHAYAADASPTATDIVLRAATELGRIAVLDRNHPLLGSPRLRIGPIRAGEHLWRTPARASAEIAIGLVPGTELAEAEEQVREVLEQIGSSWGGGNRSFSYEILDASEPVEVPPDLPIVGRLAEALGTAAEPAGMPSWTDAANLLLVHRVPCVVFGAGDLACAHSDRESVPVPDLLRLSEVLRRVLRNGGKAR